ncbi:MULTISPECIES: hypothetical protein [Rhizobium/Agrobacterium group]|uniref:hypothetical protein n=1 Tax=Rhizobium/Agrobacterium group TaxID=227290 RepID=UPI0008DC2049|nr:MULTISPECIES: hypothetical protein [Rhizobium/Agrobacterium group]MCF1436986.1 hypothetical protein [Allorhizobium ampelinum]MCF1465086.1 hypothetical protein [Allorhizobium ampelinum]MCF1496217.1 hypothetical protein [Allorhizobium ampelinum]MUO92587.1 hypothetical protein [Agrobacterium vitis]MUZ55681.1 hypothetical protein [Agrobacterium vitis]
MTVDLGNGTIVLSGKCGIEEAETLVSYLENHRDLAVDVAAATEIHTALWQALLLYSPQFTGTPQGSTMADLLVHVKKTSLMDASKT